MSYHCIRVVQTASGRTLPTRPMKIRNIHKSLYQSAAGVRTTHSETEKFYSKIKHPNMSWRAFVTAYGLVGLVTALVAYISYSRRKALPEIGKVVYSGKPTIGGPWELVDHNSRRRTNTEFLGQWVLLYFGYTHCPDICPEELQKMADAIDILDKLDDLPSVQPIFISYDPERDTVPVIADYLKEFSTRIIGFTGSTEETHAASKAYKLYYGLGLTDDDNDYMVDHTIVIYLLGPDGTYAQHYWPETTATEIAEDIQNKIRTYNKLSLSSLLKWAAVKWKILSSRKNVFSI